MKSIFGKHKRVIVTILAVILGLIVLSSLVGCPSAQIADENGADDLTVVSIKDDEIVKNTTKYITYKSVRTTHDGKTKLNVGKLSGVWSIDSFKAEKGKTLVLDITTNVTSGNFRAVIVHDGTIAAEIEVNKTEKITIDNADGRYYLKLVGETAEFTAEYSFSQQ